MVETINLSKMDYNFLDVYLVKIHDSFRFMIQEYLDEPCFQPGRNIGTELGLINHRERSNSIIELFEEINLKLKTTKTDELRDYFYDKLIKLDFNTNAAANNADIVYAKPARIIPCIVKCETIPYQFHSETDQQIMIFLDEMIKRLDNFTWIGGSMHIKYYEKFNPTINSIDFRTKQASYNPNLKRLLNI